MEKTFVYIAKDSRGSEVRGRVKAHDRNQAIANIRAQGLYPTALGEVKGEATSEKKVSCKKPKSHLLKNALAVIGKKLIAISESM